jgi:hypothetical protein
MNAGMQLIRSLEKIPHPVLHFEGMPLMHEWQYGSHRHSCQMNGIHATVKNRHFSAFRYEPILVRNTSKRP